MHSKSERHSAILASVLLCCQPGHAALTSTPTMNLPFFEGFTKEQVKEILKASNIFKVKKGKVVVAEGEIDDSFYVLLSGKAVVQKNGNRIATIGRGECFGEMAFLSGQARTASVVAETDCNLIKISATLLDRASAPMQALFLKTFAMTLIQRLSKSMAP